MSRNKSRLIVNRQESVITHFTCNALPTKARVRYEELEGRPHVVVPMVILTEGVHHGSGGPLYYPPEELGKTPVVWDQKPIVVYHPELNGQPISACKATIVNTQKIGVMMNTKFEGGKLKSEAWIEAERADKVDSRIMDAVKNGKMMELSTGVFVDEEATTGTWNTEEYDSIARNFRPDHLALLPDKIGACSIADGAGFLRNKARQVKSVIANLSAAALDNLYVQWRRAGMIENEMSFSNIRDALCTALKTKLGVTDAMNGPYLWVEDVYADFVVYEYDGKLWRVDYTSNSTTVSLSDEEPVQVKRETVYRAVDGSAYKQNQEPIENKEAMKKEQIVGAIITANIGWSEADREGLMKYNEADLNKIHSSLVANKDKEKAKSEPTNNAPAAPVVPPVVPTPEPKKPVTLQGFIAEAPPELQGVLNSAILNHNNQKAALVKAIMANARNPFSEAELQANSLEQLQKLATFGCEPQVVPGTLTGNNYAGMAPTPTTNNKAEEPLELPTINWDTKKEAAK